MADREVKSLELKGEALAWALCAVYRIPAMILNGVVQAQSDAGDWAPFDHEGFMRSIINDATAVVMVPSELLPNA